MDGDARLERVPAEEVEDGIYGSSACWRGYVAHWRLEGGQLWLDAVRGRWRLVGGPVRAEWVTTYVRVHQGSLHSYVHAGFASSYNGVRELDLRGGRLHRQRAFAVPASGHDAPWLEDPATSRLFACTSDEVVEPPAPDPAPGTRVRAACIQARQAAGLRVGQVAERIGLHARRGARIAEWEQGSRTLDPSVVAAIGDALGIDADARGRLDAADAADARRGLEAFLDAPIAPVLAFGPEHSPGFRVAPPASVGRSREAILDWARTCVEVSWWSAVLYFSRRERTVFDADGRIVEKAAMPPGAP
jgi:transcriptional regulator with XRE-family HTH domain